MNRQKEKHFTILTFLFFFICQSAAWSQEIPAMSAKIRMDWELVCENRMSPGFIPIVYKDVLIMPTPGEFYSIDAGRKISNFPCGSGCLNSVLYRYNDRFGRNYVEIRNLETGATDVRIPLYKQEQEWCLLNSPILLESDYYFAQNDTLFKYDITNRAIDTIGVLEFLPSSALNVWGQYIYYSSSNNLVVYDTIKKKATSLLTFDDTVSSFKFNNSNLIFWIKNEGVVCLDLKSGSVLWTFKPDYADLNNVNLIIDENLFFSSRDLYCVDISSGDLIWRTYNDCSYLTRYTRVFNNYVIHYNNCFEEGDFSPALIELLDKRSGVVLARGWTSEQFPVDENTGLVFNEIDYEHISFIGEAEGKSVFAIYKNLLRKFTFK